MRTNGKIRAAAAIAVAAASVLGAAAAAPAAGAATPVDQIAAELAARPLYVDPEVDGVLTDTTDEALAERLAAATTPVFIAVLPGSTGSDAAPAAAMPAVIAAAAGRAGTYGVVTGTAFHATSTVLGTQAETLAEDAIAGGDDAGTALLEFVDAVELAASQAAGGAAADRAAREGTGDSGPLPGGVPWLVALAGAGGLAAFALRRRAAR